FYYFFYFDISRVTLTVNTNQKIHRVVQARDVTLTTPLKSKSIKPFRLQSVPNNYTYIHTYIHTYILLAQSDTQFRSGFLQRRPYILLRYRDCLSNH
ncbi:hypothetical protein SFRURICE_009677, partial [Spodoptera frugiperda]